MKADTPSGEGVREGGQGVRGEGERRTLVVIVVVWGMEVLVHPRVAGHVIVVHAAHMTGRARQSDSTRCTGALSR